MKASASGNPPFGGLGASKGGGGAVDRLRRHAGMASPLQPLVEETADGAGGPDGPAASRALRRAREQTRLADLTAAVVREPRSTDALAALAAQLALLSHPTEAHAVYRKIAALDPAREDIRHMIAALSAGEPPLRASDAYLRGEFDALAERYDEISRDWWGARAADAVSNEIRAMLGPRTATEHVVDLGCGTGLVGERFRMMARRLEGVDIAPKMIEGAQARGIYDALEVEEIGRFLVPRRNRYTIAVAGDVICYYGELVDIFRVVARSLKPGCLFAFTVERFEDDGFELRPTGRYAHSDAFVREAAAAAEFSVRRATEIDLRVEHGAPIGGRCYVFERRV